MNAGNDTKQIIQAMRRGETLILLHVAACVVLMLASTMVNAASLSVSPRRVNCAHDAVVAAATAETTGGMSPRCKSNR